MQLITIPVPYIMTAATAATATAIAASTAASASSAATTAAAAVAATMEANGSSSSKSSISFEQEENPLHHPTAMGIFIPLYTITCLLGIFGNGLICVVVINRPKMRTVINLFICNLALSDLVLCSFGVPLTLTGMMTDVWPLGLLPCKFYSMVTACMVLVSSLTFTAVAIDRFCLVVYPFLRPITKTVCMLAIVVIWIISLAVTLPIAVQSHVIDLADAYLNITESQLYCLEIWNDLNSRRRYSIALFIIQFVYPLLLVIVAHASIAITLKRKVKPGARRRENDIQENKRRQRTNRMLSAVVTVFAVCWLPLNIFLLVIELGDQNNPLPGPFVFVSVYLLAISSTWLNPMLYAWLNDNFRKEFYRIMPFLSCLGESRNAGRVKESKPGASTTNLIHDKRPLSSAATYLQPTSMEKSSSRSGEHDTSM